MIPPEESPAPTQENIAEAYADSRISMLTDNVPSGLHGEIKLNFLAGIEKGREMEREKLEKLIGTTDWQGMCEIRDKLLAAKEKELSRVRQIADAWRDGHEKLEKELQEAREMIEVHCAKVRSMYALKERQEAREADLRESLVQLRAALIVNAQDTVWFSKYETAADFLSTLIESLKGEQK